MLSWKKSALLILLQGCRGWVGSGGYGLARTPNDIEYLISQISLGDREAFSQLYDATSAKLLGVCLRVLNERANAEEAMQDTFIKVWKNADRYSINGLSPMTWLITIARNTAIDRLRAQKPVSDINDYSDSLASKLPSPESNVAHSSDMKRVRNVWKNWEMIAVQLFRVPILTDKAMRNCRSCTRCLSTPCGHGCGGAFSR